MQRYPKRKLTLKKILALAVGGFALSKLFNSKRGVVFKTVAGKGILNYISKKLKR